MRKESARIHPGHYVRENILNPRKLTVTEAARLIGVSRPGVSNFLNAKVSATPDMAARLERAFGVPAGKILDLQHLYDAQECKAAGAAENARAYVPPFLNVQANDLEAWSTTIAARTRLSVLLRTLVHSTGYDLKKVDFPGHDDAERPGWDGFIEAGAGTPWIPAGRSGWEFGVTQEINTKASGDFEKSMRAAKKADREETCFVFVTPRRWPAKAKWAAAMKAKKSWKDVRAYDASDLEQWMEQSIAGQTWFANQTARPSQGVRTLDMCWTDWADVAQPPLHHLFFSTAKDAWGERIKSFLTTTSAEPLVLAADSVEEALAFLSQVLAEPGLEEHKDRVLVFDRPGVLPQLAQGTKDFIAVAHSRQVEREFGPYCGSLRTIVVYPRNATNPTSAIVLEPVDHQALAKALEAMGKAPDEVLELANKSGRSLTVLRRQLSTIPAIRTPKWAADHATASCLIPLVLLGAWDSKNSADQAALSDLAGGAPYEELERRVQKLLHLDDSPVWSIGGGRGVISKIDSLFAVAGAFTNADLNRFLGLARRVLGEDNPALDLPEQDRWAAAIHGKQREFSGAVREGISETLVLLAVHGTSLFGQGLGFDGEGAAAKLVRELLDPISPRKLEAHERELPLYAEAAPNEFLGIIERDLRSQEPKTLELLRPVSAGVVGLSCVRTGLLWALEGLAWNPSTFPRVVDILARLSKVELNDNWANKPIASLGAIFRAWMPQTAADHTTRLRAIQMLFDRHPAIGWQICVQQFGDFGFGFGRNAHKPKWRRDGHGFGQPFTTWDPIDDFTRAMVEKALGRPVYTVEMLCDLIERLHVLGPEFQERIWKCIDDWRMAGADDEGIAKVREKIRVTVLSRRARRAAGEDGQARLSATARAIFDSMQPRDPVNRHAWLFREGWVDESADELATAEYDFNARARRIEKLRLEALTSIFDERGLAGMFALAQRGRLHLQIGALLARGILSSEQIVDLIRQCLRPIGGETGRDGIAAGALRAMNDESRNALYASLRAALTETEFIRLLLLSPYRMVTWELVEQLAPEARAIYWREVVPYFVFDAPDENNESVRQLLAAGRPRAAFVSVHFKLDEIRPSLLVRMLADMAKDAKDKPGEYPLEKHYIRQAFRLLNLNPDVSRDEKAMLEVAYLDALARPFPGGDGPEIPNLEGYVEDHPEVFVQAVVWAYKRKNGGEDPPELGNATNREQVANRSHGLLAALERIPGQDKPTEEERRETLREWVRAVRKDCGELDRTYVADHHLGELFAKAPPGEDGVWPNEIVRDVMEDLQSEEITRGALLGRYNARGIHECVEGGVQERELAEKYRGWAEALQLTHSFLSSSLLMRMVQRYEREAKDRDTDAGIRRRSRY